MSDTTEIALQERGQIVLARLAGLTIQTSDDYQKAAAELLKLVTFKKEADAFFDPEVSALYKTYKTAFNNVKKWLDPYAKAEAMLREQLRSFEKRRRAREAAARAAAASAGQVAVVAVAPPPKVDGLSFTTTWKGRVTDKMALLRAIVDGKVTADLALVDGSLLNKMAQSQRDGFAVPGAESYTDIGERVRT